MPWIKAAETLTYWGDIDQKSLEIFHHLRSRIRHLRTILMDRSTYDAHKEFGTEFEPNGNPVKLVPRTASEHEIYDRARHRRFEQERVPLLTALAYLQRVTPEMPDLLRGT